MWCLFWVFSSNKIISIHFNTFLSLRQSDNLKQYRGGSKGMRKTKLKAIFALLHRCWTYLKSTSAIDVIMCLDFSCFCYRVASRSPMHPRFKEWNSTFMWPLKNECYHLFVQLHLFCCFAMDNRFVCDHNKNKLG